MRIVIVFALALTLTASALAQSPFQEAKHGAAELKFVSGVPVLTVSGKPAEIGEQIGVLVGKNAPDLIPVLNNFLRAVKLKDAYPALKTAAANLKTSFPADHRTEIEAIAQASGYEPDMVYFVNSVYDLSSGMGCSTLLVEKNRSSTGAPLFGRNFDWVPSEGLPQRTLVLMAKPEGKRAYVSVTLAPITGVISGMNDAGLCVTINEVRMSQSKDQSKVDWNGVPTLMAFRRVLEECTTIAEAEKLLRGMKRMSTACMSICDPSGGAVFEITPKNLIVRNGENGVCCCTNHFCTEELCAGNKTCPRLDKLVKAQKTEDKLGVSEVFDRLHEVNQKNSTMHSMVFEPTTKTLHLKIGDGKESATTMKAVKLELGK
jgi:predicted choloylglycine hydrolase